MSTGKIELSVGTMKIANKYEIFTEEEIDAINNKIPELDERVGVIEDEIEEINTSLETKAKQSDLEVEKNRIDNIIKNEGTSINDLELQDIRIDIYGVTHSTSGVAIRNQILRLQEKTNLDEINKTIKKEFIKSNGVLIVGDNHVLSNGYGNINSNTGLIELNGDVYQIEISGSHFGVHPHMCTFAFFDKNKQYLQGTNTVRIVEVPTNARYVAIGNYNVNELHTDIDITLYRHKALKLMIENEECLNSIMNNEEIHPVMTSGRWLQDGKDIINGNEDLSTSGLIKIPKGTISVTCNIGIFNQSSVIAFYDKYSNFITGVVDYKADNIPSNAKYIRLSNYRLTSEKVQHDQVTYKFNTIERLLKIENRLDKVGNLDWNDKKWCVIGDSITEVNFRAEKHYWKYINELTDIQVINKGISGTGYKQSNPFYNRIKADDFPTDCNIITIMGGINDILGWDNELPIGEVTDNDNTTICGCVNLAINSLEEKYPSYLPLGIISPLPADVDLTVFSNCRFPKQYPSITDCRLEEFTEKLRKICLLRGYPFLDLFHTSGLRPWDLTCKNELFKPKEGYGVADGLHPNSKGHEKIYRKIFEFIKTIIV